MKMNRPENDASIERILTPRRGRWVKRSIACSVLAFLIVFAVSRLLLGSGDARLQYKTEAAVRGGFSVTVTATGNLQPTNEVDVGTEVSGTVKEVAVDYNDRVTEGQVLARLDTSKLQAQLLQAKASLESAQAKVLQAQATVKETKNELGRLTELRRINKKAISQHDLEAAEAAWARAVADEADCKAEVSRNQAVLAANETDLSKTVIRSHISGIVLTRSVEPGQTVAATMSTPVLFTLAEDLTKMKLLVDVDEADVGEVREGQTATFTVDAYANRRFPARIVQVRYGSETTNSVVTYKAVLDVDNSDFSLRPGMTATAEITVEKVENAVLVPNVALRFAPSQVEKQDSSTASGGGIMSKLIPHPRRTRPKQVQSQQAAASRVWVLREGIPVAVPVEVQATNGTFTSIKEGPIKPDTPLVVDTVEVKS